MREYVLGSANQEAYDRCNVPRSAEEAEADLDGFARAVQLLRMEFRIPELVLGASVPVEGGEESRAATVILGNRAHAAPRLAASLLRHADRVSQILLEEARRGAEASVDWAAARKAVCAARAALEGAGDPGILGDVWRLVGEGNNNLRAAQDAVAGLGTALRSAGLWYGRQRDAVNAMVRSLGGEPPRDEWRWAGRAGCDWDGAENALSSAAIDADAWQAIRSRRRTTAVAHLRAAAEPAEMDGSDRPRRRVSDVLNAIDSLTEVDEVLEQVAIAATVRGADHGALERRVERVLDRLGSDDPRRGHAETLRAVMERRKMESDRG